jgi:hypothetical protein
LSRMTCQTKRCSPGALPSTLDGGGIMLRACPAVCAHPDAAPATHTAVRTARHNPRHRRCAASAATTPGTGVLEQSFVEAVDSEMAAAASPATWLPQTPPPAPVTSPPTREGDWSQKHYAQVCQHPHWQHPACPAAAPQPRWCCAETHQKKWLGSHQVVSKDQGRRPERSSRIVYRDTPHALTERLRVQRRAGCVVGGP